MPRCGCGGQQYEASDRPVGDVVRESRLASGLNQAALAARMGVTQQFLSQVETGIRPASLELRQSFSQALGIPPEDVGLAPRARGRVWRGRPRLRRSRQAAADGGRNGIG